MYVSCPAAALTEAIFSPVIGQISAAAFVGAWSGAAEAVTARTASEAVKKSVFIKLFLQSEVTIISNYNRTVLRRKEFVTTVTLEKAIASAASMGLSRPQAASGMPTALKINAQNKF